MIASIKDATVRKDTWTRIIGKDHIILLHPDVVEQIIKAKEETDEQES